MKYLSILVGIVIFFSSAVISYSGDIAVIVHPKNPLEDISVFELKKYFLYEREFWNDGTRVYLVTRESGSAEKIKFIKIIYDISEADIKRLLLSKLFNGNIPSLPRVIRSNRAMRIYVANVPNSIGYIDTNFVDPSVKILKIEGKLPGDPLYLLRSGQ